MRQYSDRRHFDAIDEIHGDDAVSVNFCPQYPLVHTSEQSAEDGSGVHPTFVSVPRHGGFQGTIQASVQASWLPDLGGLSWVCLAPRNMAALSGLPTDAIMLFVQSAGLFGGGSVLAFPSGKSWNQSGSVIRALCKSELAHSIDR